MASAGDDSINCRELSSQLAGYINFLAMELKTSGGENSVTIFPFIGTISAGFENAAAGHSEKTGGRGPECKEEIGASLNFLNAVIKSARRLSRNLSPLILEGLGLNEAGIKKVHPPG